MTLSLRYAAASDVGLLRQENQDSAYAGPHLLAVADGVSGNVHGEVASAAAIRSMVELDREVPPAELVDALRAQVDHANSTLRDMVAADASLDGMGTTLTALLYSAGRLCLAHVGDSRAYLLRDGRFAQVTKDHSFVQSLVDGGNITSDQAAVHPQRSLILRALDGRDGMRADLDRYEARPGDRWLLCSDGLSDYVAETTIRAAVTEAGDVDELARRLVALGNEAGGRDNITCVLAEVVDVETAQSGPVLVGAASDRRGGGRRRWWHSLLGHPTGQPRRPDR